MFLINTIQRLFGITLCKECGKLSFGNGIYTYEHGFICCNCLYAAQDAQYEDLAKDMKDYPVDEWFVEEAPGKPVETVKIHIWPDGSWCEEEELEDCLSYKSDDYVIVELSLNDNNNDVEQIVKQITGWR